MAPIAAPFAECRQLDLGNPTGSGYLICQHIGSTGAYVGRLFDHAREFSENVTKSGDLHGKRGTSTCSYSHSVLHVHVDLATF